MVLKGLGMGFLALSTLISIEIQTKNAASLQSVKRQTVLFFFLPCSSVINMKVQKPTLPYFKHYILNIFFRCYKLCCSSLALLTCQSAERRLERERCKNEERVAKLKCKLG